MVFCRRRCSAFWRCFFSVSDSLKQYFWKIWNCIQYLMIILYRKKSYYCSWWYKKSSRLKTKNLLSRKIEHFQRPDTHIYIYIFFGFLIEKRIICHKHIHSHLVIICFDTFASRIYLLNSLLTTCTPLTPSPSCHLNYPPSCTEIYANSSTSLSINCGQRSI